MGILDAPAIDFRGVPLAAFAPRRDLPGLIGWWDFSTLTGADGTGVVTSPDKSGLTHDLMAATATLPTKQTGADGKPVLRTGPTSGSRLVCAALGQTWPIGATVGPPVTMIALVKPSSTGGGSYAVPMGGYNTGGKANIYIDQNSQAAVAASSPGGGVPNGGNIKDDNWHVIVATVDIGMATVWVDGYLASLSTSSVAHEGLKGFAVGDGGTISSSSTFAGDFREVMVCNGRLSASQIEKVTAYLAGKSPTQITVGKCDVGASWQATTDAGGQNVRIFAPPKPATPTTIILFSHQAGGDESWSPNFVGWPIAHAAMAQGWYLATTRQHGDSWGNTNATGDLVALYNLMHSRYPEANVILGGMSMGGVPSLLAQANALIPNVKGIYLIDPVTNLLSMYPSFTTPIETAYGINGGTLSAASSVGATSVSSSVSFPSGTTILIDPGSNSETVTTTGAATGTGPYTIPVPALAKAHASGVRISDYPAKTAGRDPNLLAASAFNGARIRFVASAADTTVTKSSNSDAFASKIASTATEAVVASHPGSHIAGGSFIPADFVATVKRWIGS